MEDKRLVVFRRCFCFSKDDLQKSFEAFMNYKENNFTPNMDKLYHRFFDQLKKMRLPLLADTWWCYDYTVNQDSIDLELIHCEDIRLDENDELSMMSPSEIQVLFSLKCEYLTIEQFSQMHGISENTTRRWIKHGKLRSAKKQEADWLIPEMSAKPKLEFEWVSYQINKACSQITLDDFPILRNAESIDISQDKSDSSLFKCSILYQNNKYSNQMIFSKEDIEDLEVLLISDPNVEFNGSIPVLKPNIYSM